MEARLRSKTGEFEFTKTGANLHVDDWLANDREILRSQIDETIRDLAHEMVAALVARSTDTLASVEPLKKAG